MHGADGHGVYCDAQCMERVGMDFSFTWQPCLLCVCVLFAPCRVSRVAPSVHNNGSLLQGQIVAVFAGESVTGAVVSGQVSAE